MSCRGFWLHQSKIANPTQKPLLQVEFLLRGCHQGGWVMDLCCGTGTSLVAALRMGFSAIGIDSHAFQAQAASARLQHFAQIEVKKIAT